MPSAIKDGLAFPLPIPVTTSPWEGLASVLSRVAAEMGYRRAFWLLDPDDIPDRINPSQLSVIRKARDYQWLSYLLRLSEEELYELTLHRFAVQLQDPRVGITTTSEAFRHPLLTPFSVATYSLAFAKARVCPLCLDEAPLFDRLYWCLKPIVACLRHRIFLIDRCPQCSHTIPLLRDSLLYCPYCAQGDYRKACVQGDYRKAPVVTIPEDPLFQVGQALIFDRLGIEEMNKDGGIATKLSESPLLRLLPWQYFLLVEAFRSLILPLFPDVSILHANAGLAGSLRHVSLRNKTLTVSEEAVFIATFHDIFTDWPEKFFALLRVFSQGKGHQNQKQKGGSGFGMFYLYWLYDRLEDPAFGFLREAFADYLAHHYDRGYVKLFQRAFRGEFANKLQEKRFLSLEETSKIMGVVRSNLDVLVEQGHLQAIIKKEGQTQEHKRYLFDRASVEALQREWEGLLSPVIVAQVLGISDETVITLEDAGLLTPAKSVRGLAGRLHMPQHSYERVEIEQFIARLLGRTVPTPEDVCEVVPLATVTRGRFHLAVATILSHVLSGDLTLIDTATDQPLLQRLALPKKDITHFFQQNQPQQWVTFAEAAASLGVGRYLLKHWIKLGLFSDEPSSEQRETFDAGVPWKALELFRQNYISGEETGRLLEVHPKYISALIRKGVLHPVVGRGVHKDTSRVLLKRKEVENLAPHGSIGLSRLAELLEITPVEIRHLIRVGRLRAMRRSEEFSEVARFQRAEVETYLHKQVEFYENVERQLSTEMEINRERVILIKEAADMLALHEDSLRERILQERISARKILYKGHWRYDFEPGNLLIFIRSQKEAAERLATKVDQYFAPSERLMISDSGEDMFSKEHLALEAPLQMKALAR